MALDLACASKQLALAAGVLVAAAFGGGHAPAHGPPPAAAGDLQTRPCRIAGLARPARCGTLDVAENPDRPARRRLAIHFVVVPASAAAATEDPIVVLMGGPGEPAIPAAADYAEQLATLRRTRDLLLVDQRGTGASAPLTCPLHDASDPAAIVRDFFPPRALERCTRALRDVADLTQYGYANFARDLEALRAALGYGRLNLYAASYGTRAAQVYVRMFPASVRTLYLGSIVPIDVPMPLPFAQAAQAQLAATFDACEREAACSAAYPRLRGEFRAVMARLAAGRVKVAVPGDDETVTLTPGRVGEWIRAKLYRPSGAALLPRAIHRAHAGDWTPIVDDIVASAPGTDAAITFGTFFAITCSEDVAYIGEADVARATAGTFIGDYRIRQQQAACRHFPRARLPAGYREPVRTEVPTMLVSGDSDGGTPQHLSSHAAAGFAHRTELVMANRGHTEWSACVAAHYAAFLERGEVAANRVVRCVEPRPPFALD